MNFMTKKVELKNSRLKHPSRGTKNKYQEII